MGVLYDDLKLESKFTLSYKLLLLLRRAAFVLLAFFPFYDIPSTMQIKACVVTNLIFNLYVAAFKPFDTRKKNRSEVLNEVTIYYASMSLYFFSDYSPDLDMQYFAGWMIIGAVLVNMIITWGLFLIDSSRILFLFLNGKVS